MALKSMSIEKLVALKEQVEAALSSKVVEQRKALESSLSKLGRFQGENPQRALAYTGASRPNTAIRKTGRKPGLAVVRCQGGWPPQ